MNLLAVHPLLSSDDSIHDVFSVLVKQAVPLSIPGQILRVSNDHETVSSSRDCDIDPVVFLDKIAGLRAHH